MKGTIAGLIVTALIGSDALAQTRRPPANSLAVRPIPSENADRRPRRDPDENRTGGLRGRDRLVT